MNDCFACVYAMGAQTLDGDPMLVCVREEIKENPEVCEFFQREPGADDE